MVRALQHASPAQRAGVSFPARVHHRAFKPGDNVRNLRGDNTFTQTAFSAAQQSGRSILVDIPASWCSTCQTQAGIIGKIVSDPKYKDVLIFDVDFDSQKDVVRALRAQSQSTLIGFKGGTETRRSAGDTDPLSIEDLIESTL